MKPASDRLVEAYFSPQANELKARSAKALTISIVVGVTAVSSFTAFVMLIFLSILGLSPLSGAVAVLLALLLLGIVVVGVILSWVFTGRYIYLRVQLNRLIQEQMTPASP